MPVCRYPNSGRFCPPRCLERRRLMIHAFTFCFLSLLLALLIPILGTRVVRGQGGLFEEHKEVAGFIYATIGVLYAVVLGFSVVMMSERYNACIENTDSEAA